MGFNETNTSFKAKFGEAYVIPEKYIKMQSDWDEENPAAVSYIKNKPKLPTKISDLEDDSQETPIQNALWAMQSDYTACDNDGNYIPHTYATKTENAEKLGKTEFEDHKEGLVATHEILFHEVEKKLERGWNEIGTTVVTQADVDKCTAEGYTGVQGKGVYCGDLTQYVELMCIVRIHSDTTSLNTTAATWFVGLSADVNTAPDDYSERMNSGYFTGYQPKLQPNKQNEIIVRSYFMDGSHLFSEHFGSDTGGFGGLVSGSIARIFEGANGRSYFPTKLEGKNTYWFASFISPSLNTKFVLPVGTTITVYGR